MLVATTIIFLLMFQSNNAKKISFIYFLNNKHFPIEIEF